MTRLGKLTSRSEVREMIQQGRNTACLPQRMYSAPFGLCCCYSFEGYLKAPAGSRTVAGIVLTAAPQGNEKLSAGFDMQTDLRSWLSASWNLWRQNCPCKSLVTS